MVYPTVAWIPGYNYRVGHYINGSDSGSQTNYPILQNVSNTTGSSAGDLLYLQGHSLHFPYDIVVTDSSDNPLSYWNETFNVTSITNWNKIPTIPQGSTNQTLIYFYYGNSTASSASSGINTFTMFDDYLGASLSGLWTLGAGTIVVNGSLFLLTTPGSFAYIYSTQNFGTNVTFRTNTSLAINHFDNLGFQRLTGGTVISRFIGYGATYRGENAATGTNIGTAFNGNSTWEITRNGTTSDIFRVNNSQVAEVSTGKDNNNGRLLFQTIGTGSYILSSWSSVRQYVFPEPFHSTYLLEEPAPCTAVFSGTPLSGEVPLSVQFTDSSTSGIYPITYYWDFGDSTPPSTLQNPAHTYTTTGAYDVKLKVSNGLTEDWENKTAYVVAGNATTPTPTPTLSPTFTYLTPTPTPTPAPQSEFFTGNISISFEDANPAGPGKVILYNETGAYVGIWDTIDTIENLVNGSYEVALQPSKTDYLVNPKTGLDAVADFLEGNLVAIIILCLIVGIVVIRRKS